MISLKKIKEIYKGSKLTDEQLVQIRDFLYMLATLQVNNIDN